RRPRARALMPARPRRGWTRRLVRDTLLWLLPSAFLWLLLTPLYNRLLLRSAEAVLHLTEYPTVTDLLPRTDSDHDADIARRDFPPARSRVHAFRVSDLHFHFVLLGALFLGVPGIPWQVRLGNLAAAALLSVAFDVVLLFFYVKSIYATQLGAWSLANYGPFSRNFYGLAKHLLDLPFKLALPLVLWAAFYLRLMREEIARDQADV
ncbi:MAG: hypothetical protein M3O15_14805, partial [Acidobacteriota bacterium]|nr:hypothetical protein [Acidobacteriota bacterium]